MFVSSLAWAEAGRARMSPTPFWDRKIVAQGGTTIAAFRRGRGLMLQQGVFSPNYPTSAYPPALRRFAPTSYPYGQSMRGYAPVGYPSYYGPSYYGRFRRR